MKYDKMWYELKEQLMNCKNCGEMNIEDLLHIMNRIEIDTNKESNKTLFDLASRTHPNT